MKTTDINYAMTLKTVETIEDKLVKMKVLQDEMKILEAEFKMIKEQVIADYFVNHQEYKTAKGLIMATYICTEPITFSSTKFKVAHPGLYDQFCDIKKVFTFRLK